MRSQVIQVAAAAALAGALLSASAPTAPDVSVGDEVSFTFQKPLLNGMGVTQLADLKGKPVLVEFWGTR